MKLYTSAAIARTLGMAEKEIKALTKVGVIKGGCTKNGLYKLEETAREILANYKKSEDERENVDYMSERAKLMRAKRLSEEYALKQRKGEMHRSEDIEFVLSKILVSFKSKISAIPTKAAPRAAKMSNSADIYDMIKELTDEALTDLSNFDAVFKECEDEAGNDET